MNDTATHDDQIRQGATFYRQIQLFTDAAKTTPLDLTGKTVRSTLMDIAGNKVADFACSVSNAAQGIILWAMSRGTTATLDYKKIYIHSIDTDESDNATTIRRVEGRITINPGQVKTS